MKLKEVEIPQIPKFIADWVDNLKSGLSKSMIGCMLKKKILKSCTLQL